MEQIENYINALSEANYNNKIFKTDLNTFLIIELNRITNYTELKSFQNKLRLEFIFLDDQFIENTILDVTNFIKFVFNIQKPKKASPNQFIAPILYV